MSSPLNRPGRPIDAGKIATHVKLLTDGARQGRSPFDCPALALADDIVGIRSSAAETGFAHQQWGAFKTISGCGYIPPPGRNITVLFRGG